MSSSESFADAADGQGTGGTAEPFTAIFVTFHRAVVSELCFESSLRDFPSTMGSSPKKIEIYPGVIIDKGVMEVWDEKYSDCEPWKLDEVPFFWRPMDTPKLIEERFAPEIGKSEPDTVEEIEDWRKMYIVAMWFAECVDPTPRTFIGLLQEFGRQRVRAFIFLHGFL